MFKGSTPANTDTGADIIAQLLSNDVANKLVDDTAVLAAGVTNGKVVKYNATNQNWSLCDGTAALAATDIVGIVEYVNGTSGQVRIAGVYTDSSLTSNAAYYCQSNGSLGTSITKVFMGRVTSPGRLCMPAGGGGSFVPATATSLGMVIAGSGLSVDSTGLLKTDIARGNALFIANSNFVSPADTVFVSLTAGGGGVNLDASNIGGTGGNSSFGSYITATGGRGGRLGGGSAVNGSSGTCTVADGIVINTINSPFDTCGNAVTYASGGYTAYSGRGGYCWKVPVTVGKGTTIAITAGAAGSGSAVAGQRGAVYIEW